MNTQEKIKEDIEREFGKMKIFVRHKEKEKKKLDTIEILANLEVNILETLKSCEEEPKKAEYLQEDLCECGHLRSEHTDRKQKYMCKHQKLNKKQKLFLDCNCKRFVPKKVGDKK